jgi:zinc-ribbon domain
MIRCGQCGRDNADGMRFCTNCGAALGTEASTGGRPASDSSQETISFSAPPPTSPTGWPTLGSSYAPPQPAARTVERKNTGLIVGVVVLLLLGLLGAGGVLGWYFYSKSKTESSNENTENGNTSPTPKPTASNTNARPTPTVSPSPSNQSFAPPTVPSKEGTFTVYANEGWQLSGIAVVPYEKYTTHVEGIVDLAGAKAGIHAGGDKDAKLKSRRLFAEYPTGALLMRTRYADGRFSNTVAAGESGNWENLPEERGMLEFAVNDNAPQGNGGQFTVRVKMTSVPKNK